MDELVTDVLAEANTDEKEDDGACSYWHHRRSIVDDFDLQPRVHDSKKKTAINQTLVRIQLQS